MSFTKNITRISPFFSLPGGSPPASNKRQTARNLLRKGCKAVLKEGIFIRLRKKAEQYCRIGSIFDAKRVKINLSKPYWVRLSPAYAFEEHTPENSVRFLKMLTKAFPFRIKTIQTDNGTEFTYKYISDEKICPFDKELSSLGINHKLIPPRTPWHNGKAERSHRNDQRYFYDWETFTGVDDLNKKLAEHLIWSNNKPMRTLDGKSPVQMLKERLSV